MTSQAPIVASAIGSPAAIVAAVSAVLLVVAAIGRGTGQVFGFQRSKINELLQAIDDLKAEDRKSKGRIAELERIVAATQVLPVAGLQPILDKIDAHEDRAQLRHEHEMAARRKESEAMLGVLQTIANHWPPEQPEP